MPRGYPLDKTLTREWFIKIYKEEKSLEGIQKKYGYDPKSLRKFMKRHNINFKYKTIYTHNDDFFSEENEHSLYWSGFIAADGCIKEKNKNTKILSLSLASKDKHHILFLKKDLQATEPVKDYNTKYPHSSIHIVSNKICNDLEKYNIVSRKTHKYDFPNHLENSECLNHFIRGYFDGDGSVFLNKQRQLSFSMRGTINFLTKVQKVLIKECGVNKTKINNNYSVGNLIYLGNGNGRKIYEFLYKDCTICLERKRKIFKLII